MADEYGPLLFLDIETTGLDVDVHEVWEIAWAFDDNPVRSMFTLHDGSKRSPEADEVNHYLERCPDAARRPGVYDGSRSLGESSLILNIFDERPTIVSSAPSAVDIPFLRKRWGCTPWHYRAIDISSYAMLTLGHERPAGQWQIATELRDRGFDVPLPDHSAAADVASLRACYRALQRLAQGES